MTTVASKVPFSELAGLLEKISKKQGADKKLLLQEFINRWRDFHGKLHADDANTTDSFYSALRLLLPHLERERAAYGIKENTLAKLYIEVLCLGKDSPAADKLIKYRAPKNAKG
ncbi:DNA ligase 4-like, partial [Lingula anatina]